METIRVTVKPNSSRNEILSMEGEKYKIAIKAAPDKGRANKELIKFLSRYFKKKVTIISGFRSREKLVRLI